MARSPLTLAAVLALVAAAPAAAAPAPMDCRGMAFDDPAGDASYGTFGTRAPDNLDLRGGFFRYAGGELEADIVTTASGTAVAAGADGGRVVMTFTAGGTRHYVAAKLANGAWSGEAGDVNSDGSLAAPSSNPVPAVADSVAQIPVPKGFYLAGQTLTAPAAMSFVDFTTGEQQADVAPASGTGTAFEVDECPPPPLPPPPPPPPAQPGIPTTLIPTAPVRPAAPYTVTVPRLRAKLLRKGRTFTVVVVPGQRVTSLTVTLSKGGKVLAKGRLASLAKKATVKLKVAQKTIPRGTYKLTISGRTPTGRTAAGAVAVDVV